ncbi:hypothetical protein Ga0466249_004744 [Sporomusaceae bacterium BoRhaA]|uniref:hypothetical protein n=1 Tax=Pelorhabdus rhamnosifermentans TaxID=2772457 RepID=UPI001C0606F2|nr:hypothetical protein [Pelorhabdus rhamnosifermentans]MBU2703599.1 hypothetical protein [Pelorhabdus rhamnosifermentans]
MRTSKDTVTKTIGFPENYPIPLDKLAYDLAVAKTASEITDKDEVGDVYYRYYYNYEEFIDFFKELKERGKIEIPILKEIKP